MPYDDYIAWKRLTHNGRRGRDQMSPAEQAEWDALGVTEAEPLFGSLDEAKLAYEEATGRSRPASDA